jgi:hypothetical protein
VAPGVPNGGFETGTIGQAPPNWDVSQAPGAVIAPARTGFWGNQMLHIPGIANGTTVTILSNPITIPIAGLDYCAMIQPKLNGGGGTVTITVVDANTGLPISVSTGSASGYASDPQRGTLAYCTFQPVSGGSVRLKISITSTGGGTISADLDHADFIRSQEYGVIATHSASGLPNHIVAGLPQWNDMADTNYATIKNGTIVDGGGNSWKGSPVWINWEVGAVINGLTISSGSPASSLINGYGSSSPTITNCTITGSMDIVDDRMAINGTINLGTSRGAIYVAGNTIRGATQDGILISRQNSDTMTSVKVLNNDIRVNCVWTDGYGIGVGSVTNFEIAYNTVIPVNGRGMYIDGMDATAAHGLSENGTVHDNDFEAREAPNMEYSYQGMEATALRVRNGTMRNITFSNNVFAAYTGPGLDWAAAGARIGIMNADHTAEGIGNYSHANDMSNMLFINNTFKGIVTQPDPNYTGIYVSQAWGLTLSRVDPGTGLKFVGNTFASNVTPLNVGDNDSYAGNNQDVSFISNTVKLVTDDGAAPNSAGMRSFKSIAMGDWGNNVSNIRLIDMAYANGATSSVTILNTTPGAVSYGTGWLLNVTVTDGSGNPVSGGTVSLFDNTDTQVYTGTTDASGQVSGIAVVTAVTTLAGTTSSGPFSLVVTQGTKTKTTSLNLTGDLTQAIVLN